MVKVSEMSWMYGCLDLDCAMCVCDLWMLEEEK